MARTRSTRKFETVGERNRYLADRFPERTMTETPGVFEAPDGSTIAVYMNEVTVEVAEALECLDGPEGCDGAVEYRPALSSTGKQFPRCDLHWEQRVETQEQIRARYPDQQPADFDPLYAGERWSEDD